MPGSRSKIEVAGYADQVAEWLADGMTMEAVAAKLNERHQLAFEGSGAPDLGRFTRQDIKRFKAKIRGKLPMPEARAVKRWNKEQGDALSIVQDAVDFALSEPVEKPWSRDVQASVLAKLAVAREKLKILGAYPREGLQVNVGVKVDTDLRGELRAILGVEERPSTDGGSDGPT